MRAGSTKDSIRLLDLGLAESWQTQAVYHAVAEMMRQDSPDTLIICRPRRPYLCLGYHQVLEATLDRRQCELRGLPVVRRRLGGGVTYLDANQLFYQCIFHHSRVPPLFQEIYKQMLAAPVATLRRLGLNAHLREVNEIEVAGRRVAGTGGGRIGEASVVVGNLLFDFDYQTLPQLWRVPWESFRKLAAAALRERITTLKRLIGDVSMDSVQRVLLEQFAGALGRPLEAGRLSPEEERCSFRLASAMASADYLNLHRQCGATSAVHSLKISASVSILAEQIRIDGHRLRGSFRVREGTIDEARLESEPARNWRQAETGLRGQPFAAWKEKVQHCLP